MMCGDGLVELGQRPAYRRPLRPGSMTSRILDAAFYNCYQSENRWLSPVRKRWRLATS